MRSGVNGVCEPQGFCSFADPGCPGGQRFDTSAGNGLANACVTVDAGVIDAPADAPMASCVADVGLGRHFSCVLATDHTVWCAGENDLGELGGGTTGMPSLAWVEVLDATTSAPIADATAIGIGGFHGCALRAGGAAWCWGADNAGQVGNNATTNAPAAVAVQKTDGTPLVNIVAIAGGSDHTCALDGNGGVWCWGANSNGELGDGTTTERHQAAPVLAAAMGSPFVGAVDLTVGNRHSCLRKANGDVYCWGWNGNGQVGDDTTVNKPTPVKVANAMQVAAGVYAHTCAVAADGSVTCWGSAWRGRLGNNTNNTSGNSLVPTAVVSAPNGAPLVNVASIAVGGSSCALMHDGTVQCWGDNVHGQSGAGIGALTPIAVTTSDGKPLGGVDRLVAHYSHVCAHRASGDFVCWGRGLAGEFGDGQSEQRGFPAPLEFPCR